MSKDWMVQGFEFSTKEEYEKARKEQESVSYIRAKTDLRDPRKLIQLYNSLTEKDMFETVIGYSFMETLRRYIISKELVAEEVLPPIKIKKQVRTVNEAGAATKKDYKKEYETLREKRSISRYINVALVMIVIGMFAITYYSPKNNKEVAEQQIQDEYASWQERLQQQEQQLEERETELAKKEASLR